jgi:UDP-N-acetylglucosamine acyltransferase
MTSIHPSAIVQPGARLGVDVSIGAYSIVGPDVVVGDRTRIMPHVFLDGCTTLGADCTVFPFASLGTQTQDLKYKGGRTYVKIGDKTVIREYVTVNSGTNEGETTVVGSGCLLLTSSHVAHGCILGNHVILSNGVPLAGHVVIEDHAILGGLSGAHQFTRVGKLAMVGAYTKITQDVPPFLLVDGNPAIAYGLNRIGLERHGVSAEAQTALKQAYKILYLENLSTRPALEKMRATLSKLPEILHFLGFIEASERGITKSKRSRHAAPERD